MLIQAELEQKGRYIKRLSKLCAKIGGGEGGELTLDAFLEHMEDPEMIWFAATTGIDLLDLSKFFILLSSGGKATVDLDTFVVGCIRLKGSAKSMDVIELKNSLRHEARDLKWMIRQMEAKLEMMTEPQCRERIAKHGPRSPKPSTKSFR